MEHQSQNGPASRHPMDAWVDRLPTSQRERLRALGDAGSPVDAQIHRARNGGFEVHLDDPAGVTAFLPAGESGVPRTQSDAAVGRRLRVVVVKPEPPRGYPVVSRTRAAENERRHALAQLAPGELRTGTVRAIKPFGAFVDLGDPLGDALVHISEIAPGFVDDPSVHVSVGLSVRVAVTSVDIERGRISASMKQARALAWLTVGEVYTKGGRVQGLVTARIGPQARVELAPDVWGLADGVPEGIARPWLDIDELDAQRSVLRCRMADPTPPGSQPLAQWWTPVPCMHSRWAQGGWDPWTAQWWDENGFDDPDRAAPWQAVLDDASEAARWVAAGVEPEHVVYWRDRGFGPEGTARWSRFTSSPVVAREWTDHEFDPPEVRRWRGLSATVAAAWRDLDVHPSVAARLHGAGFPASAWPSWSAITMEIDAIVEWYQAGVPPEEAQVWMPTGIGPANVGTWSRTGLHPGEVPSWVAEGFGPAEAEAWSSAAFAAPDVRQWVTVGVGPDDARAWSDAGIAPAEAKPWARLAITPGEAGEWVAEGFDAAATEKWSAAGCDGPRVAAHWRAQFPHPREAGAWLRSGFDEPASAIQWSRHLWAPADAVRAWALGIEPRAGAIPRQLAKPTRACPSGRSHRGRDLFGVPGTDGVLKEWLSRQRQVPTRRELHATVGMPAASIELDGWALPSRMKPDDSVRLMADLARRLGSRSWEVAALHRIASATPFLFRPQDAALFMEAEPVPADIQIRLPFPTVLLLFGAGFSLEQEHRRQLRRAGTSESFEPWLDCLHERGGDLLGVAVRAGAELTLADDVVWLVAVDSVVVAIPGRLSKSQLATPVKNLLVGTTHPLQGGAPTTRRRSSRSGSQAPPRRASDVHVIDIRRLTEAGRSTNTSSSWRGRSAHLRRAHWHRYRVGPRDDWRYELRFILPTYVGGVPPRDNARRVYRLPQLGGG